MQLSVKAIGGAAVLAGVIAGAMRSSSRPNEVDISRYRSWTKVNAEPIYMEPMVAALCVPTPRKWGSDSPHLTRYFNVYVNAIGKKAMFAKRPSRFPAGTIIVKEKFPANPNSKLQTLNSKSPELLTIMVKREKGFNPKCGDWEFRTASGGGELHPRASVEHCISCHVAMPEYDYTYRTYIPGAAKDLKITNPSARAIPLPPKKKLQYRPPATLPTCSGTNSPCAPALIFGGCQNGISVRP